MSDKKYRDGNLSDYDSYDYDPDDYREDFPPPPIGVRRDKKTGCLGGLMYFVFIVSVSVILACLGWMAASDVLSLNKEIRTVEVTLPEEIFTPGKRDVLDAEGNVIKTVNVNIAEVGKVAGILKDAGIIEYKSLFLLYSSISDAKEKMDPGTYSLSTEYDYRAIVKKMQFGSDSQLRTMVTFPEGFTVKDIFQRLEENKICKYADLMDCAASVEFNYRFLEGIPMGDASRLEGFLFPNTYEFYQGMTPEAAIDTFLQIFHKKLTAEMWELTEAKGFTMRDVVNIASMIEKEAANDSERKLIASVIFNRLKVGEKLGIDATILYDMDPRPEKVTADLFQRDTPYNTRMYAGLPPTPIANPGIASIMAALRPETTNYMFYALDLAAETHKFFTNASEFNAFVATQNY